LAITANRPRIAPRDFEPGSHPQGPGRIAWETGRLAQGERSPAFLKIIIAGRLEVPSVDEYMESARARGGDPESHGCARHAPADRR